MDHAKITDVDALTSFGNALMRRGEIAAALPILARAAALRPDSGLAHYNHGCALQAADRLDEAVLAYRASLCDSRLGVHAAANLGTVLARLGQHGDALRLYDSALAVAPEDANLRWNRATTLLALGDHARGWREFEWRWRADRYADALRHKSHPLWSGEPLAGERLLIHAEQGYGDTLQFIRYVPLVAARGATVILEVQRPLKRLLAGLAGVAEVYAVGETLPDFDLQCPLLGLPLRVGGLPDRVPYLEPPARRSTLNDGPAVGLVWAGSHTNDCDSRRSLALAALGPILAIDGVRFASLQTGPAAAERRRSPYTGRIAEPLAEDGDFADTAAIVADLDLVIAVDTAVAHLAGALGKMVWLLNRFDGCWRWETDREDSPWYRTMRIFRQAAAGDWSIPVARVAAELAALASGWRPEPLLQ